MTTSRTTPTSQYLPAALVPDHWTPDQALAVYEFLQDLIDTVWDRYDTDLIDLLGPDPEPPEEDDSPVDLDDSDEGIPF